MSSKQSSEFEAALHAAQAEYRRNLPRRIAEINALWGQLTTRACDGAEFETFVRLAHRLAGSGETYGFTRVSRAARALELYAGGLDGSQRLPEQACAKVQSLIKELANAAGQPPEAP